MRHYNSFAFGGGGEVLNINKLQKFRNLNLQLIGIKIFGLISPINHNLVASHHGHFTLSSPDHSSKEGVTRPAA